MRLALAQINTTVGDLDGNRERIGRGLEEAKARGRRPRSLPGARRDRLPARGPALAAGLRAGRRGVAAPGRARDPGDRRARRLPALRPRPLQRLRDLRGRRGEGRLPQALPAQLRRLRRGPVLRARPRPVSARARRDADRPDDLRGPLAAGAACDRPRAGGRPAAREHLGLPVPPRPRPGARGDVRDPRARQLVPDRLLQRGRRAGRADLRRPFVRARRGGAGARPRARVRGDAARRRRRAGGGSGPAAARRPPPRARARARESP